ncbi:hypothetical protein C8F01DRAFT_1258330 [Mycena amicta]|nr:hypothetical protein C8F01DRAFT_1258330 [Mycena amicta]
MDSAANATVEALRSRIQNTPTDDQELRLALISELNALVDPIQLLPLELSSKIFMLCYDKADAFVLEHLADVWRHESLYSGLRGKGGVLHPADLMVVCQRWKAIALATTKLWASIYIPDSNLVVNRRYARTPIQPLVERIGRAGTRPIALALHSSSDSAAIDVVNQFSSRFGTLEVAAWNLFGYDSSMKDLSRFTSLRKLCILTELLIAKEVTYCELVGLLCTVPQLEECILPSSVWCNEANEGNNPAIATLPRLRRLTFMMDSSMDEHELPTDFTILQFLNLPALESLDIQLETIGFHNFLKEFFTRSAPMLETLSIKLNYDVWAGPHPFVSWLLAVPSLKHLDIWETFTRIGFQATEIVSALAPHQSHSPDTTTILPNLLSLRFINEYPPFHCFPAVASVLEARRSTLKEFSLYFEAPMDSVDEKPDDETAATFERLRKEAGMDIFVGRMVPTYYRDLRRRILSARC